MSPTILEEEQAPSTITPLRIQKTSDPETFLDPPPSFLEDDESHQSDLQPPQPLSELGPMEQRRNSPSSNKSMENPEEGTSPMTIPATKATSTRTFWQSRENTKSGENSLSVGRRSSIERLKRASRVQNNTKLFNLPDSGRPLSYHAGQSPAVLMGPNLIRSSPRESLSSLSGSEREKSKIPLLSSRLSDASDRAGTPPPKQLVSALSSPSKNRSPTKSSLVSSSKINGFGSPDGSSSDGYPNMNRSPTRRPKSVTFDKEVDRVLEFEMITPEPSIEGSPGDSRYDSDETDDEDYDLENTPVIEPDAWGRAAPETGAQHDPDDLFRQTPSPNGRPLPPLPGLLSRADTSSPNGGRPLPTLPLGKSHPRMSLQDRLDLLLHESPESLARKEVWENTRRNSAPETSMSHDMSHDSATDPEHHADIYEDREDAETDEDSGSVVRYSGESSDRDEPSPDSNREHHSEEESQYESSSYEYQPPTLSRESIRRQVAQQSDDGMSDTTTGTHDGQNEYSFDRPSESGDDSEVYIKEEPSDDEYGLDINAIPELNQSLRRPHSRFGTRSPDADQMTDSESSAYNGEDDMESSYSHSEQDSVYSTKNEESEEEHSDTTPTPGSPVLPPTTPSALPSALDSSPESSGRVSLPEFSTMLGDSHLGDTLGLQEYMNPPDQTLTPTPESQLREAELRKAQLGQRDSLTETHIREEDRKVSSASEDDANDEYDEDDTGSVIRHKIYHSESDDEETEGEYSEEEQHQLEEGEQQPEEEEQQLAEEVQEERSPSPVAEAVATIRAPGGKLKTRASATPADMAAMAAARRCVSGDQRNPPPVPRMPHGYRSEGGSASDSGSGGDDSSSVDNGGKSDAEPQPATISRKFSGSGKRKSSVLPALGEFEFDLKLDDLSEEFDRVIEKQKRGYLMRQNTRVIHASSVEPEDDERPGSGASGGGGGGGPGAKPGHARGKSWSVEPWRTNNRRRSQRESLPGSRKRSSTGPGPVPPLPGQETVAQRLPSVAESDCGRESFTSAEADNVERGRLFVKVIGVKDLTLPLPQGEPQYFCLTLDNGLHCVTTSWLELGKNAPIGQEFELVVLNDLEFQLTLQTKLEAPPPATAKSPAKVTLTKPKQSTVSKFFTSPKKRRQMEAEHQQQMQAQKQQQQKAAAPATAWDLLHGLVARDGSFARSYVTLKDFESRSYGRPFITDITCFNEWAIDTASVKSKKGVQSSLQPARKAPYKIGKLEVQLFFVPKPKGTSDNDLPKSMSAAIRELKEAEQIMCRTWEGTLSQQGGDCPYWRRRYFKLNGVRLTAYHEATRQPRATINLSKATRLIDDRRSLVDPSVPGPGKTRRKSGFSEEEEGYMFVEEGFRIRFGNGEVIDFYADSAEDKRGWMKILGETVGHVPDSRSWCQMVLSKEAKRKADKERRESVPTKQRSAQAAQQQASARLSTGGPVVPPKVARRDSVTQRPAPPPSPKSSSQRGVPGTPTTPRRPVPQFR